MVTKKSSRRIMRASPGSSYILAVPSPSLSTFVHGGRADHRPDASVAGAGSISGRSTCCSMVALHAPAVVALRLWAPSIAG